MHTMFRVYTYMYLCSAFSWVHIFLCREWWWFRCTIPPLPLHHSHIVQYVRVWPSVGVQVWRWSRKLVELLQYTIIYWLYYQLHPETQREVTPPYIQHTLYGVTCPTYLGLSPVVSNSDCSSPAPMVRNSSLPSTLPSQLRYAGSAECK